MHGARAAQLDAAQGPAGRVDGERLMANVIALAGQYGCYGYRTALLRQAGWSISDGRFERIWKRERLKVPHKKLKTMAP
jgi:putative transposase